MKKLTVSFVVVLIGAAACLSRFGVLAQTNTSETHLNDGTNARTDKLQVNQPGGLIIRLSPVDGKTVFGPGEPIDCLITIENKTSNMVSYFDMGTPKEFILDVKDSEGAEVPKTRYGKIDFGGGFSSDVVSIDPGKSVQDKIRINRLIDLTVEGKYSATISKVFRGNSQPIVSNVVPFTVGFASP